MGMPFQCFRHEHKAPLTKDVSTFCTLLAEDLERLSISLANDSISLKWSAEAMNLLKRMQKELLNILKKSALPISYGTEDDWFDQYMKDSATLLDFCNSLKAGLAGINRYRMVVDFAVKKIEEGRCSTMFEINKLQIQNLRREQEKPLDLSSLRERIRASNVNSSEASERDEKGLAVMMLASKTTMIVLSLLLVSAVINPIQNNMRIEKLSSECPEPRRWMEMLTELVCSFNRQIADHENSKRVLLAEHEVVVEEMRGQIAAVDSEKDKGFLLNGLQRLRRRSFELKEGVERFGSAVNEVFEEVIRGRNEMLDMFRNSQGSLST